MRFTRLRFKRRSDLQAFAAAHPGALAAHMLCQIREKMSGGPPTSTSDIYKVDPTFWGARDGVLKDARDVKELSFLCQILLNMNKLNMARVADMATMRITELRFARASGQSWEKAEVLGLLPNGVASTTPVPDAAMCL